ncbi:MAG: WD40 repeat domain-containing protein [Planctomycetes bacterium]|nr:WD40 repeat domain-containing protein [Planctomycetota bacterium]
MPILLSALSFLILPPGATAGDDIAKARLKELQVRVVKQQFESDTLRRDLIAFAREQVGTPLYPRAIEALRVCPAPVDRLDVKAIDDGDFAAIGIDQLVGVVRSHGRAVASLAFSFDGGLLASSSWDNTAHISKLGGKEPKSWATLDASPSGIAFSPDGKQLATGCADTQTIVWDLSGEKPKQEHKLSGHNNRPFALAFAPKGKTLASGCFDPVLRIFKLDDLTPEVWSVVTKEPMAARGIWSLAFSHDAKYLVGGSHFGKETLRVWDVSGQALQARAVAPALARVVACSPTEAMFAFAGDGPAIQLWGCEKDRIEKIRAMPGHSGQGLPPAVKALAFSPDGKLLASAGQDKHVRLWTVSTGEKAREWKLNVEPRALAFSSDGRHLAIGNSDGTIYLLRLEKVKYKVD